MDELKTLLRNRNLKATGIRLEVLQIISEFENAIPYTILQKKLTNFDRVTLYRTLNSLTDKGIIHKAAIDENDTYYALCEHTCDSTHHHHEHIHFKCVECKSVSCLDIESSFQIPISNHDIHQIEVVATGVCENCKK